MSTSQSTAACFGFRCRCGEPAHVAACTPWERALCAVHAATADVCESVTLNELADEAEAAPAAAGLAARAATLTAADPPSPKIKVEPAEQIAEWAPLDSLPLPDGCPVVVDITGEASGGGGGGSGRGGGGGGRRGGGGGRGGAGRGGRGVPKKCARCGELLKGGCPCRRRAASGGGGGI